MKCSCCDKKIKGDERVYEIGKKFYCDTCVEKQTVTFYKTENSNEPYHEDNVTCYENINNYTNSLNIKIQIKITQGDLEYYSKRQDKISKQRTEYLKLRLQKLEEQKRKILGEDEK